MGDIAFRGILVMLRDVFKEKKRISMTFFAMGRASAPSEAQFKPFFDVIALYYK